MIAEIIKSTAKGTVAAPPSKSMAHRNLICAALSGNGQVSNIQLSEDIKATLSCLKSLGAQININDDNITIGGLDIFGSKDTQLHCNESGSTLRFMIPLCLLSGNEFKLVGSQRLLERPLSVYEDICREQNIFLKQESNCITVKGPLKGGNFKINGSISSQFISGLLFALPLLMDDSRISFIHSVESMPYIDMTISVLNDFGICVKLKGNELFIKGGQTYKSIKCVTECDYSNAAFLDAFNLFGGNVSVTGLNADSLQGDSVYKKLFDRLNKAKCTISLKDCPDLGPILFTIAAAKHGAVFTDTKRLRIKESDRVACVVSELSKFGARFSVEENKVTVHKTELHAPDEILCGHNDHRIVMSLSVLASAYGGTITGVQAVNKSFPDFFDKLSLLGIEANIYDTYQG